MAKFEVNGLESFKLSIEELAMLPDSVLEDMVSAQADVVTKEQKQQARTMGVIDTGAMAASIAAGTIKRDKSGNMSVYVYPQGSRTRNGIKTRNAEIAFINEFGKQGQVARPFIKTANEKSADATTDAAEKVYNNYVDKLNL